MISSNYIPEKISEYNAYLDGSKMIGVVFIIIYFWITR